MMHCIAALALMRHAAWLSVTKLPISGPRLRAHLLTLCHNQQRMCVIVTKTPSVCVTDGPLVAHGWTAALLVERGATCTQCHWRMHGCW
jgi:hypothetical protein